MNAAGDQQQQPRTRPQPLGSRRTVSTLAGATAPEVTERPPAAPEQPAPTPAPRKATNGPQRAAQRQPTPVPAPAGDRLRYDEMERKEARLREDQVAELNRLARQLARSARRARPAGATGERITDNTLIRVAIDLLLSKAGQLRGGSEEALRRSLGL